MRGKVVVETESEYQAWLGKQKTFALSPAQPRKFGEAK
jgi:heme/copper-type cytochrome/quinol oxidase subunit 2